ncbi:MAG: glycosyltransferase [Spirochaetaceae bacterium]
MKITMMVGSFPSVSQQYIFNQMAALIDSGIDLDILASSPARTPEFGGLVAQYGLMDRVRYAGVPESNLERLFLGLAKLLKLLVLAPGRTLKALNVSRYRTASTSLKTIFYLDLLRKSEEIPLLHCHFGPMGLSGLFLKDLGLVRRLLVTFHGSDINSYPRRYGADVYAALWSDADAFTANTSFTAGKMRDNGCRADRISIHPVGLRPDSFPVREYSPDPERFVLLTVGRLAEKKGHRYALEAVARLEDAIPAERIRGLEYWIVGDGPLRREIEGRIEALGLAGIVKMLGARPSSEVKEFYHRCDLFLLPSVTASSGDMEGQGLVLQEAQATGCPVLSTLHNGIPDGVLDGETGLLVPEGDAEALARAIRELAGDRDRLVRMGEAAAKFVRTRYDISRLNEQLTARYVYLLSR